MGLKAVSFFVNRHGSLEVVVEKRGAPLRATIEEAKHLAGLVAILNSRPACSYDPQRQGSTDHALP